MKVRMLTLSAGPGGVHQPGEVRDLPQREAEQLVAARCAVPHRAGDLETTELELTAVETATPRGRRVRSA